MTDEQIMEKARAVRMAIEHGIFVELWSSDEVDEKEIALIADALRSAYNQAVEDAAKVAERLFNGFHSPYEYSGNVEEAILRLKERKTV